MATLPTPKKNSPITSASILNSIRRGDAARTQISAAITASCLAGINRRAEIPLYLPGCAARYGAKSSQTLLTNPGSNTFVNGVAGSFSEKISNDICVQLGENAS